MKKPPIIPGEEKEFKNTFHSKEQIPHHGESDCQSLTFLAINSLATPCVFLLDNSSGFFAQGVWVSSTSTEYLYLLASLMYLMCLLMYLMYLPVGQLDVWVDLKLSHIRVVDHNHRVPHLCQSNLK